MRHGREVCGCIGQIHEKRLIVVCVFFDKADGLVCQVPIYQWPVVEAVRANLLRNAALYRLRGGADCLAESLGR